MLPQFGLTEFMLVAIVALIVVGPKDLPLMMRKLGQFVAKGRAMAREFQSAFDDIARQAELDELRKEIEDLRRDNALTEAVNDMKKAESDINRRVMMENPWPEAGKEGGPGVVADDKAAPAVSGESASSEKPASTDEKAKAEPDAPAKPDDDGKKAASS
ncbi:Sec-independent protein translocase protein TatB [Henriciella algicola]|uniref:Sec-independent protein translocase protein TatB n=1 Tax=Henriciella algicola TaxID=1608422 RepID=A0A399RB72_9PROT|nr:Sec-independent protein translocase protein TatB [Henriciella algicola]RIJ28796.1 twin-arginine translocase subunit TatB [Henriciella algicola]